MGRRILALTIKELLALLKDRRSRFVLIVPPFAQLLIFGFAASFDLNDVAYAVYNEDLGGDSRELLAGFDGSPHFRLTAVLTSDEQIAPLIDNKQVMMVVHIGPRFSRDLRVRRPAAIQVIVDGRDSNTAMVALGYARGIVDRFGVEWAARHGLTAPNARLETRAWFNPNLESRWFIVPGIIGLLTQVVSLLVTSLSVAREREEGTFDQLLVTPFHPAEILLGKALPGFVLGMLEASGIIAIVVFAFRVPLVGSLLTLYVGLALFLIACIGVGLMISSLSLTQQQGLLGAFLFLVPSVILSGFATPIANMPPLLQEITRINPLRYFLVILRGVFLEGTPFEMLLDQFWPLAVIGAVNLTVAAWLFRRRMG